MRKSLLLVLLVLCFSSLQAQMYKRGGSRTQGGYSTGRYASNSFLDNWEVCLGVGLQSFCGVSSSSENGTSHFSSLMNNASLGFNASLSKWLLPSFGVRMQAQGLSIHNYDPSNTSVDNPFSYLYVHADALINLTHAIWGYNPEAFYSISFLGGFGAVRFTPNGGVGTTNEYAASIGMHNRFKINEGFVATLEMKATLVKEISSSSQDVVLNRNSLLGDVSLGITYLIPFKRDFDQVRSVIRKAPKR